jgi:phosphohistidine phosphatase
MDRSVKQITLVRHAQAESALAGQSDFERSLTRRGTEDASEMARRLKFRKLHIDHIVSSTAPRAYSTAEIFARVLRISAERIEKDDRLYTAGPPEFITVVRECSDESHHVLVAAHNPGITEFADKLSNERRIDSMPTCAVVTMRFNVQSWRELSWNTGVDVELDYPGRPV